MRRGGSNRRLDASPTKTKSSQIEPTTIFLSIGIALSTYPEPGRELLGDDRTPILLPGSVKGDVGPPPLTPPKEAGEFPPEGVVELTLTSPMMWL